MRNNNYPDHLGFIYKYVNHDGIIQYIGKAKQINRRHYQHQYEDKYGKLPMYYFQCDLYEIDLYEALLIKKYKPKYNKQYLENIEKNPLNFTLQEPKWILWEKNNNFDKVSTDEAHLRYNNNNKDYKPLEKQKKNGRPRKIVDKQLFEQSEKLYSSHQITREQQRNMLGIAKTRFYKILHNPEQFFLDQEKQLNDK